VSELWFENFSDWRRAVIEQPPAYTKPSWATQDAYPFVKPFEDLVSSFIRSGLATSSCATCGRTCRESE